MCIVYENYSYELSIKKNIQSPKDLPGRKEHIDEDMVYEN